MNQLLESGLEASALGDAESNAYCVYACLGKKDLFVFKFLNGVSLLILYPPAYRIFIETPKLEQIHLHFYISYPFLLLIPHICLSLRK